MVSFIKAEQTAGGLLVEGFCLSTDTMPVGVANGSTMEVLDASTGALTTYRYNASGSAWVAIAGTGGTAVPEIEDGDTGKVLTAGSSGPEWADAGGGGGVLVVHMDYDEETEIRTLDKTWQEIYDAGFAVLVYEGEDADFKVPVKSIVHESSSYSVLFTIGNDWGNDWEFEATEPDGYPQNIPASEPDTPPES